ALGKQVAHLALRFAQPHVENLRPFHTHEKLRPVNARLLAELQPQVVRRSLAQQRLAASGRAVEQEALGHRMLETLKEARMQEGQLDAVADAFDGFLLAANGAP